MIFCDAENEECDVIWLDEYYPIRNWSRMTPKARRFSETVLEFKDGSQAMRLRFAAEIDLLLGSGFTVTVVPPHAITYRPNGEVIQEMALIGSWLAAVPGQSRSDGTSCLVRHTPVPKKSFGGERDLAMELSTVKVERPHLIAGREVLLLDDVYTSGVSSEACCRLLMEAGALRVKTLVLGRTI